MKARNFLVAALFALGLGTATVNCAGTQGEERRHFPTEIRHAPPHDPPENWHDLRKRYPQETHGTLIEAVEILGFFDTYKPLGEGKSFNDRGVSLAWLIHPGRLISTYDPAINYKQEYRAIARKFAGLQFSTYSAERTIDRIEWDVDRFAFTKDSKGNIAIIYTNPHSSNRFNALWVEKKDGNTRPNYTFERDGKLVYRTADQNQTNANRNQLFYLAWVLSEQYYPSFKQMDDEWQARPWKTVTPNLRKKFKRGKKKSYTPQGELVFYGQPNCPPCSTLTRALVKQRIKFREREDHKFGTRVPYIFIPKGRVTGVDRIIEYVEQAFHIRRPSLPSMFMQDDRGEIQLDKRTPDYYTPRAP